MKKSFTYLICFLFFYNINAQKITTYKGERTFANVIDGIETYPFYEKQGKRIKQGEYSFKGKLEKSGYKSSFDQNFQLVESYVDIKMTMNINGKFHNGLASGNWTLNHNTKMNNATIKGSLNGGYKNGLPAGLWIIVNETQEQDGSVFITKTTCTFNKG